MGTGARGTVKRSGPGRTSFERTKGQQIEMRGTGLRKGRVVGYDADDKDEGSKSPMVKKREQSRRRDGKGPDNLPNSRQGAQTEVGRAKHKRNDEVTVYTRSKVGRQRKLRSQTGMTLKLHPMDSLRKKKGRHGRALS